MPQRKRQTTIIKPDGTKRVLQWKPGTMPALEWLQKAVEGHIELIPGGKNGFYAYANEEGLVEGLPANPTASDLLGYQHLGEISGVLPLVGTVVVLEGFPINGESLKSVCPDILGE